MADQTPRLVPDRPSVSIPLDALAQIIGSMRNFAAVADHCTITEVVNGPPSIRTWADMLSELIDAAAPPAEAADPLCAARKTDCSYPACECKAEAPGERDWKALVDRFLMWPLPASVCVDLCAVSRAGFNRSGTNLLTADEAEAMLRHVLRNDAAPAAPAEGRDPRLAFFDKHALGTLLAPSCLVCGHSTQGKPLGITHGELPGIVVCAECTAKAKAPRVTGGREVVAELIAADLEYDAAEVAWDAIDTRDGIGDDRDGRDYEGPEYARLFAAISRRAKALQAATGGAG